MAALGQGLCSSPRDAWVWACSVTAVVSDPLRHYGLYSTSLLHPWGPPGKNTGVGCHCLLHRGSSQRRDQTHVSCGSCTEGTFFTTEPPGRFPLKGYTEQFLWAPYRTQTPHKWRMLAFFIPERTTWGQIKGVQALHTLILRNTPTLEPLL